MLVLDPGVDRRRRSSARPTRSSTITRRSGARWSGRSAELPRTEGTRKLKRAAIRDWVKSGARRAASCSRAATRSTALSRKYAGPRRSVAADDARGARAELARARRADGGARRRVSDADRRERVCRRAQRSSAAASRSSSGAAASAAPPAEPVDFPAWNRSWPARRVRRVSLPTWILPLARVFAWTARRRARAPARSRRPGDLRRQPSEPHGRAGDPGGAAAAAGATASRRRWRRSSSRRTSFRQQHGGLAWFTNSLNYYLAALFFNAFPLPQREAGARQTLRYIGELLGGRHSRC